MPRPPPLQVCITIADGASYLAGCAKDFKTSAEASRITAEWMPRATAPCAPGDHDETGLCRISCSGLTTRYMRRVEQDASSGDITCTSPHAKHRRYGARRSRPRRSRALPRFLRNFAEGAEDQAADRADRREPQLERSVRRASEDWNVFLCRVLCDSMYHPDGT